MPNVIRAVPDMIDTSEAAHVDVSTITLGISLRDCSSRLPQTVRARAYDKIRRTAAHHVGVAEEIEDRYGVRIADKRISVTPIALIADGAGRDDFVALAQILDAAAAHVGVDYLTGFSALVEKGMTRGDEALIGALPEALASTQRVCASVCCGSTVAGIDGDVVLRMAHVIKETARLTRDRDAEGCARLVTFCNTSADDAVFAGAFHGVDEAEAVVNVGISGPAIILRAVRAVGDDADFGTLCDAIKRVAFKVARAGQLVGRRCAERLAERSGAPVTFGNVVLSLAPTPDEGASLAGILRAMGLEDAGAPGTMAALALLDAAVKRGGLMAARPGHVSIANLASLSAVCSAGIAVAAIPGDTPVETIAGMLLDTFAVAIANDKTTGASLIPVHGKTVGDHADFGKMYGSAPILPVSSLDSSRFVRRGGRIPAPIRGGVR